MFQACIKPLGLRVPEEQPVLPVRWELERPQADPAVKLLAGGHSHCHSPLSMFGCHAELNIAACSLSWRSPLCQYMYTHYCTHTDQHGTSRY